MLWKRPPYCVAHKTNRQLPGVVTVEGNKPFHASETTATTFQIYDELSVLDTVMEQLVVEHLSLSAQRQEENWLCHWQHPNHPPTVGGAKQLEFLPHSCRRAHPVEIALFGPSCHCTNH